MLVFVNSHTSPDVMETLLTRGKLLQHTKKFNGAITDEGLVYTLEYNHVEDIVMELFDEPHVISYQIVVSDDTSIFYDGTSSYEHTDLNQELQNNNRRAVHVVWQAHETAIARKRQNSQSKSTIVFSRHSHRLPAHINRPPIHVRGHLTDTFYIIYNGFQADALVVNFYNGYAGYRANLVVPHNSWAQLAAMPNLQAQLGKLESVTPDAFENLLISMNIPNETIEGEQYV